MTDERYTESGLYKTSSKTIDSFVTEYELRRIACQIPHFFDKLTARMKKEDPILSNYLEECLENNFSTDEEKELFTLGAIGVYEILRRQAEANKPEKEVNGHK